MLLLLLLAACCLLLLEITQTQTRTHGADTCARAEAEAEADDAHVVYLFTGPEPLQLTVEVSNPSRRFYLPRYVLLTLSPSWRAQTRLQPAPLWNLISDVTSDRDRNQPPIPLPSPKQAGVWGVGQDMQGRAGQGRTRARNTGSALIIRGRLLACLLDLPPDRTRSGHSSLQLHHFIFTTVVLCPCGPVLLYRYLF